MDEIVQTTRSIHPAIVCGGWPQNRNSQTNDGADVFVASVQTMVQNAVRGIPLGQTDGQKLLVMVQPYLIHAASIIETLDEEELRAAAVGLEIAQMQHERLPVRLFMCKSCLTWNEEGQRRRIQNGTGTNRHRRPGRRRQNDACREADAERCIAALASRSLRMIFIQRRCPIFNQTQRSAGRSGLSASKRAGARTQPSRRRINEFCGH
ncbi:hypothetical protein F6Y04_00390 [Bacillus megaterium]|nr:hypothetical protein [Priestia megaterium]